MLQRFWLEWITIALMVTGGAVNFYLGSWHILPLAFACMGAVIATAVGRVLLHIQLRALQAAIERCEQIEAMAQAAKDRFDAAMDLGIVLLPPPEASRDISTLH